MVKVTFIWPHGGSYVEVTGNYDGWKSRTALKKQPDGKFAVTIDLDPGTYEYKFIVDGNWHYDGEQRFGNDGHGNTNNIMEVAPVASRTSTKKTKEVKSEVVKDKNSSKGKESQDTSDESSQPLDGNQKSTGPAKWVAKTFNKVMSEKKTDEGKPSPVAETTLDKKSKTHSHKFTASVKYYQSVQKKPDSSWSTSSLENTKMWKEKRGDQLSIEIDTGKPDATLHILPDTKKSQSPLKTITIPPPMSTKLATPNTWAWQSGSSKEYCYAIQFESDKDFKQFMDILDSKSGQRAQKKGSH